MDDVDQMDIDKAKRLHIVRQTYTKTQNRGPHGEFIKTGIQDDKEQKTVMSPVQSDQYKETPVGEFVSFSEDKSKPTVTCSDAPLVDVKVTNPISYL